MPDAQSWKNLKFDTPATYRIRVQGRLDENWSDRLGGMVIATVMNGRATYMNVDSGHTEE